MSSPIRRLTVALAASLAAACGPSPPDGLALVVQPIDTTVTLGAWLGVHHRDDVLFRAPAGAANDYICRTAEHTAPVAGGTMTRSAVFYIPDAPPGELFPADTAHFERTACRQRGVWLEREVADSVNAAAFADTLQRAIAARLGPGRAGAEIAGMGTAAWRHAHTWDTAGTRVVLGIEAHAYHDDATPGDARDGSRVIVAAYAPGSGLAPGEPPLESGGFTRTHFPLHADIALQRASADSAIRLSGIESLGDDIRRVFAHTEAHAEAHAKPDRRLDSLHTAPMDLVLVRATRATRDTAHTLSTTRRAATLLATDLAIAAYAGVLDADTLFADGATRRRLQAVGVDFATNHRGTTYEYLRPWLWEAYRTDSLGPAGRLAFIELLSAGWSTKPGCADGAAGYDRVIEHGEAALARGESDPMIHFYVGEAYRDVYSLAHGGSSKVDSNAFAPRAEEARTRAITHLVTALKSLRQRPVRHAAWDDAVRLLLRVHTEPAFYCGF